MKRILVLAWFYPPLNSSEAVVTEKLLGASRFSYDVFTQSSCEAWSYGRESDWPERANVRRICADAKSPEAWVDEALRFFLTHREDYALVMTRSMPPECHRVGLRIKALCPALPWVASFGDPIWRNPYDLLGGLYNPYSLANPLNHECALRPARQLLWSLRHRPARQRARELAAIETQTLRRADRLIFNNVSELRYMNADPARSVVIRHSFDRALIPTVSDEPRDRLRFVFTGQLNTLRCARPLLEALRRLRMDRPALPERAEFHFFGEMADADLAFILREGLDDFVRVHRPVSYRHRRGLAAAHRRGALRRDGGKSFFRREARRLLWDGKADPRPDDAAGRRGGLSAARRRGRSELQRQRDQAGARPHHFRGISPPHRRGFPRGLLLAGGRAKL